MNFWQLAKNSFRYYGRSHLGVIAGAAAAATALTGALLVGDSVRGSLKRFAELRVGGVDRALVGQDRFFRSELTRNFPSNSAAPLILARGFASRPDGKARASQVQLLGVDDRFWGFAPTPSTGPAAEISKEEAWINQSLQAQLGVQVGDPVVVRFPKSSDLSRDAPLAPEEDQTVAVRLKVGGIVSDEQFGRFSLQANQLPPQTMFCNLGLLQERLGKTNRANVLLTRGVSAVDAREKLSTHWTLEDAELELRQVGSEWELRSPRVFLEESVIEAALGETKFGPYPVLTYFVNEIRAGSNAIPYSMVAALGRPIAPQSSHQIVLNQWAAEDLQAKAGDSVELTYYVVGTSRKLEEKRASFQLSSVVPIEGRAADAELMPPFPGLAEADSCQDWDTGFPIDLKKLRPKDEEYWDTYKGTPKAFLTFAEGSTLWSNRFGAATAIRYTNSLTRAELAASIRSRLQPEQAGLQWMELRRSAEQASGQSLDFGQLFLGFSFFVMAAAVLLMAMLFQFTLEQRLQETGILLAMGWTPQQVRRLLVTEGSILAGVGSLLGVGAAVGFGILMIRGLTTVWKSAVAGSALQFFATPLSLGVGFIASFIIAVGTLFYVLRRHVGLQPLDLLQRGQEREFESAHQSRSSGWFSGAGLVWGALGLAVASTAAFVYLHRVQPTPGMFFMSGALWLFGLLAWWNRSLVGSSGRDLRFFRSVTQVAKAGLRRRRRRSLATVALLALGMFMIVGVAANRLDARNEQGSRSGTGGFDLVGESSLPVILDLNGEAGWDAYNLEAELMKEVGIVPMRVREGDDASCLNLNRPQEPRILGVDPEVLLKRKAFRFSKALEGMTKDWSALGTRFPDGAIPAIGDAASIQWALHKKLGDTIDYQDEQGRHFKIRLVAALQNSILQGSVIISEKHFLEQMPSTDGYRMFLISAPSNQVTTVRETLSRGLRDEGLELQSTISRLASYQAVQNTYLDTFQLLGGLGVFIGSIGLGILVARNVLERRGELAVLAAVGWSSGQLRQLIFHEHFCLVLISLGVALVAGASSIAGPLLDGSADQIPWKSLGLTLSLVALNGLIWSWLATRWALRGNLLKSLRHY